MAVNFQTELASRLGRDRKATVALTEALGRAITRHCGELDAVAIPGFGTFEAVKHNEQVVTDSESGAQILLPPEIELTFRPAGKLRKLIDSIADE